MSAISAFKDLTRLALRCTYDEPLWQDEYEHGAWLAGALPSLTSLKSLSVAAHLEQPRHGKRFAGAEFLAVLLQLQDVVLDLELTMKRVSDDDDDVGAPALMHKEQKLANLQCLI